MERCRDQLVASIEARDTQARDTLSAVLDSLLHLDGEVRRHAEPRFLVEATLVRLAVEAQALSARSEPAASLEQPAPIVTSSSAARPAPVTAVGSEIGPDRSAEDGWRRILESLNPQTRAYFRAARAELDGDRLVLTFPYSFHHKRAVETAQQVEPLVKSWLGVSARMHLQLQESAPAAASPQATAAPALAPEEDPVIKAAERKLEAKVVRVRPLKETP